MINLKSAKALGIVVPQTLQAAAAARGNLVQGTLYGHRFRFVAPLQ